MTRAETMMPFIRAAGSWLAAAICQIRAIPPISRLKNRAGLAQIDANAVIPIIAADIHAAPHASRECGQANAETKSQALSNRFA